MNKYFRWHLLFLLLFLILVACGNKDKASSSPKFKQYYYKGKELYTQYCSNCHQQNGSGLGLVYPPLDTSDFMEQNFEQVLCLMKYGVSGDMYVNGKHYNMAMPGIPTLTDLEIAEIATYIYNTWSHDKGLIDVKQASPVLQQCTTQ